MSPIKKVKGGFKYGKTGKVRKSRGWAVKDMRAKRRKSR